MGDTSSDSQIRDKTLFRSADTETRLRAIISKLNNLRYSNPDGSEGQVARKMSPNPSDRSIFYGIFDVPASYCPPPSREFDFYEVEFREDGRKTLRFSWTNLARLPLTYIGAGIIYDRLKLREVKEKYNGVLTEFKNEQLFITEELDIRKTLEQRIGDNQNTPIEIFKGKQFLPFYYYNKDRDIEREFTGRTLL